MSSSDDEAELGPESVTNYYFENVEDEPISFSLLPIQWSGKEGVSVDDKKKVRIFLHGSVDKGLRKIHEEVVAWKFDLSNAFPEISVLSKDKKKWIKLEKSRKSFEEIIRSELISVQCLHYARRYPGASEKSVWDHLVKVFSLYDPKPSRNDMVDHVGLISEAVKRDTSLSNSKFLLSFLDEKPRKRKIFDEDIHTKKMDGFIVDDDTADDVLEDVEDDESDSDELYDSVCAICDNGSDCLLCCDGCCMRSFHATPTDPGAVDANCVSLGFTQKEVDAMEKFYCKNCEFKQHQCFCCGKLGSSDKSTGAEVYRCANATCSYFYHPHCISKLLYLEDGVAAEVLEKKIVSGEESFTCPIHKCSVCKQGENKNIKELQFAVCRRCPTAYHRKCMPKEIFIKKEGEGDEEDGVEKEEEEEDEEEFEVRGWEGLLPKRILIYCLKHEIVEDLGTPVRDIRFPGAEEKKRNQRLELPGSSGKVLQKNRKLISEDFHSGGAVKRSKDSSSGVKKVVNIKKAEKTSFGPHFSSKVKQNDSSKRSSKENAKSSSMEVSRPAKTTVSKTSLGDKLYACMFPDEQEDDGKQDMHPTEHVEYTTDVKSSSKKPSCEVPSLDADTKRSLLALIKECASSITMEDVRKKHTVPSTHAHSLKSTIDRSIAAGRVESTAEAVRTALKKIENGCSIEDAKAICESDILNQVFRWQNKLKVYLSPFINGMRYTSFGRHFTKVDKLEEIVNILHCYVEDGDMIVDFCCGANDFSCLMKKKLEQIGKKCLYKNYDIMHPKNDFNFEERDWMTVHPDELPVKGSQLIMGINPPFGVNASLANQFIDHALEFKPKLLILIVPPVTVRLDKKKPPYQLVWEDDQFVSGKSFYLPGSVDENDKQMEQWNMTAPPLYLWSRPDWHAKHLTIAQKHGHLSRQRAVSPSRKSCHETDTRCHPLEVPSPEAGVSEMTDDLQMRNTTPEEPNDNMSVAEGSKECSPHDNGNRENQISRSPERSQPKEASGKRKHGDSELGRKTGKKLKKKKKNGGNPRRSDTYKKIPHRAPPNMVDNRSSQERQMPSRAEFGGNRFRNSESSRFSSHSPHEAAHAYMRDSAENIGYRSYSMEFREPQVRHYGQDPDFPAHRYYMGGHDPPYSQMGQPPPWPTTGPSYGTNMSAMDRYAPRLDELNHTMGNFVPDRSTMNRNDLYDPSYPRPPHPPPGYYVDSMNFAPAPHLPYSHHHSAGWLNE